jgi:hypothetical protein
MNQQITAGTAGAGYRVVAAAHLFVGDTPDWGGRPLCQSCGGERGQHTEPGRGRAA